MRRSALAGAIDQLAICRAHAEKSGPGEQCSPKLLAALVPKDAGSVRQRHVIGMLRIGNAEHASVSGMASLRMRRCEGVESGDAEAPIGQLEAGEGAHGA